jgi:hypothetical protein
MAQGPHRRSQSRGPHHDPRGGGLFDKSIFVAGQALQEEKAKKRRRMWVWGWLAWAAAAAIFALTIAAHGDERLHDGAACFNDYGELATGHHCYVNTDD